MARPRSMGRNKGLIVAMAMMAICLCPRAFSYAEEKNVEILIQELMHEDAAVRRQAAEALVQIGAPAVDGFIAALKDERADVRCLAVASLGKIGDARSVGVLQREVRREKDAMTRAFGFLSLAELCAGGIKDQGIQPFLERFAQTEKDRTVRSYLYLALGITGDPHGAEVLRRGFLEGAIDERGAAALGLGMIRDAGAIQMLGAELSMPRTRMSLPGVR